MLAYVTIQSCLTKIKTFLVQCTDARASESKYNKGETYLRDCQQITFIMLNRFCQLSKKKPTPLFLTDNIKMDRIPAKIR